MKIEIFDTGLFIDLNNLKEVSSPVLFQRGDTPDPKGLISNEIFGINVRSRKETFAYIKLNGHFIHPHVYKAFKRLWRNIERVINGAEFYSIDSDGSLIKDENGETGINFIYNNWDRINWERSLDASSIRNERIDLLTKSKKNEVFTDYQIVIPAFYRDIMQSKKGGGETDKLNPLYSNLIRMASMLKESDMFDFALYSTVYNMQNLMVDIYDYFKDRLDGKNGLIRKFLLGKNVDYCTRTVITSPSFHASRPKDMQISMRYAGVPLPQALSLCYPYVVQWLRTFFENNFNDNKTGIPVFDKKTQKVIDNVPIKNPESYFNDKYIKTMVDRYIKDPEYRFEPIELPTEGNEKYYLYFTGKGLTPNNSAELSTISTRYMTVTDLLYVCACDIVKDKHVLVTRYPISDSYGVFIARITIISTLKTEVVKINETIYKDYPHVEIDCPDEKIATRFIDSMQFSNSYLAGLSGDYDGDQITSKIIWSQEANKECEDVMNNISFFITPQGKNIRKIKTEAIQTFYALTKNPNEKDKTLPRNEVEKFLEMKPEDLTFEFLTSIFGNTISNKIDINQSKYKPTDKMVLETKDYINKSKIETTLGRFVFTKIISEGCNATEILGYVNSSLDDDGFGKIEGLIATACREGLYKIDDMYNYIDTRDWLGLQLHSIITTSFTPGVTKIPPEVKKLKEELFKKYEKELQNGDYKIAEQIEQELIAKIKEVLKDDPGLDLYISKARGSIGNNMKNMLLMRGAVKNSNSGKYTIVKSALNDGMEKSEIPMASDSIIQGAYPKAVGTADSGYLAKELLAGMQTEIIEGDDCGTTKTVNIVLTKNLISHCTYRNIKEGQNVKLLTPENINDYMGKEIHMFSPMYCCGDKLCKKCVGRYQNKFIGLDASKIATTLTNLNMKKFHDNVIRTTSLNPKELLMVNKKDIFKSEKNDIILNDKYCEFYIPKFYFDDAYRFSEDYGNSIHTIGTFNIGIFNEGKLSYIDTLKIPCWIDIYKHEVEERVVNIPGAPGTPCYVYKYFQNNLLFPNSLIIDSLNAEIFLRLVTKGKVPTSIPYCKSIEMWLKNMELSNVNFGVPSVVLEMILGISYRDKNDVTRKFAKVIGQPNSKASEYDYVMASIRQICQFTSTFTAITFEDIDTMITASINRGRDNKNEAQSPVEELFKM